MASRPQYFNSINLNKGVFCVNKLKTPIFLGIVSIPNKLNPVFLPIDYQLQSCTNLELNFY